MSTAMRRTLERSSVSGVPRRVDGEYQSQGAQLAALLKDRWKTVDYKPATDRTGDHGTALCGMLGWVNWHTSENDGVVVLTFVQVPRLKGHPDLIIEALDKLRDVFTNSD
jgi:hypothetical protein